MILSVSRRTDIPAFYTDWFFNRLREGFVLVRNPMNFHQVSKVQLIPDVIDCIVFWTKNPSKILSYLAQLNDYKYYFQVTINPYGNQIERYVPDRKIVIKSFKALSDKIGKERVIWRYDPIILSKDMNIDYHANNFEILAAELAGYTEKCTVSFVDFYNKTERNMKNIAYLDIQSDTMFSIGRKLADIGNRYNLTIDTCSEVIDLSSVGVEHAKCIDDRLISKIIGETIEIAKDKNQRDICGCVSSIDIGAYNTCKHGCLYCYANFSHTAMVNNVTKHDPNSPMLVGDIEPDDKLTMRKMESYVIPQGILNFE